MSSAALDTIHATRRLRGVTCLGVTAEPVTNAFELLKIPLTTEGLRHISDSLYSRAPVNLDRVFEEMDGDELVLAVNNVLRSDVDGDWESRRRVVFHGDTNTGYVSVGECAVRSRVDLSVKWGRTVVTTVEELQNQWRSWEYALATLGCPSLAEETLSSVSERDGKEVIRCKAAKGGYVEFETERLDLPVRSGFYAHGLPGRSLATCLRAIFPGYGNDLVQVVKSLIADGTEAREIRRGIIPTDDMPRIQYQNEYSMDAPTFPDVANEFVTAESAGLRQWEQNRSGCHLVTTSITFEGVQVRGRRGSICFESEGSNFEPDAPVHIQLELREGGCDDLKEIVLPLCDALGRPSSDERFREAISEKEKKLEIGKEAFLLLQIPR